jgi:hypothetical protein
VRLRKTQNQNTSALRLSAGVSILIALAVIFLVVQMFLRHTPLKAKAISKHTSSPVEKSPGETTAREEKSPGEADFKSGDIIFRRGLSLESRAIMAMDGQFGYSHAGIIRKSGSRVEVIHASYGEEGQTQEIIINEPLERFLKPTSSNAAAVYRLTSQDKSLPLIALSEAERFLKAKIPFDRDFNLSTEDEIYCTELVWRAFKKAGVDLTGGKFDRVPYVLGNPDKDYILPSSLLNSSQLQRVWTSQ